MAAAGGVVEIRVEPDLKGFGSKLNSGVTSAARGVNDSAFRGIGTKLAAAVGVGLAVKGIADFGKSVIKVGIETADSLNTLQAASRATDTQMQAVKATARALGNDLSLPATSAKDAAAAMTELVKASFSVADAQAAAKGSLQLAAAAQIDAARAAQIQANALNAFGLQAKEAGRVADVLANTANAASGEITDVAGALQQAGTVAAGAGISIEDTATAIGLLANAGIQGSDAGTLLKSTLLALRDTGKPAQAAIKDLGLTVYDSQGRFVGLRSIVDDLAQAQGRMSQESFEAATNVLFGSDASRFAAVAAAEGAVGFDKMAKAVGRQGGAAEVAAAKTKGLGGAIEGFKSQVETFKLDLYDRGAPGIERLVRYASAAFPKIASAALDAADQAVGAASRLGAAYGPDVIARVEAFGAVIGAIAGPAIRSLGEDARETAPVVLDFSRDVTAAVRDIAVGLGPAGAALGDVVVTLGTAARRALVPALDAAGDAAREVGAAFREAGPQLAGFIKFGGEIVEVLGEGVGATVTGILVPGLRLAAGAAGLALDVLGPLAGIVGDNAGAFTLLAGAVAAVKFGGLIRDLDRLGAVAPFIARPLQQARLQMALASKEGVAGAQRFAAGVEGALGRPGLFLPLQNAAVQAKNVGREIGGVSRVLGNTRTAFLYTGVAARTAGSAIADSLGGAVGITTAAVGVGVTAWLQYRSALSGAAEEARRAGQSIIESTSFADPQAAGKAVEQLQKLRAETFKGSVNAGIFQKAMFGLESQFRGLGPALSTYLGPANEAAKQQAEGARLMEAYGSATALVAQRLGISVDAARAFVQGAGVTNEAVLAASAGAERYGGSLALAAQASISTADAQTGLIDKVRAYQQSSANAGPATQAIADAMKVLGSDASSATSKISALQSALDALQGKKVGVIQAESAFASALERTAAATTKQAAAYLASGGSLATANKQQRDLSDALTVQGQAIATATSAAYRNAIETGKGGKAAAIAAVEHAKLTGQLKSQLVQAGLTAAQAQKLIDTYVATPDEVATQFNTPGLDSAIARARELGVTVTKVPGSKTTTIVAHTADAARQLSELGLKVKRMPDGSFSVTVNDAAARAALAALTAPRTVTITAQISGGASGTGRRVPQADGGVLDFYARGGLREKHVAQIAPAGAMRVWAEPETGGEAYIPLHPSKRSRSVDIWEEVGRRLGILSFATGGLVPASADVAAAIGRAATAGQREVVLPVAATRPVGNTYNLETKNYGREVTARDIVNRLRQAEALVSF